ncbi:MAG: hypothetical protein ACLFS9_08105, partial [Nitriliruptoraceae bacterium]
LDRGRRPRVRVPDLPPEAVAPAAAARARIATSLALGLLPSAVHPAVVRSEAQRTRFPWSGRTGVDEALAVAYDRTAAGR